MNLPDELSFAVNQQINENKHADIIENAKIISERYRNKLRNNSSLLSKEQEAIAYAISRMPATYAANFSAIKHSIESINIGNVSVLDVGAGTGSATWAASQLLNVTNYTCLERENVMIKLGQKLMNFSNDLKCVTWKKFDIIKDEIIGKFDIVICSYMLNELVDNQRIIALEKLWEATNKLLIIVEPGTPKNFAQIKQMRSLLLDKGAYLVAPCSHINECPIKGDDWCHFSARIARTKMHMQTKNGVVPYEDEKFTYLAFSRDIHTILGDRVLKHPQYRPKVVMLNVCTKDGIKDYTITKSNNNYKKARDASQGDKFI